MRRDKIITIMKYQPCGLWRQGRPLRSLVDCSWDVHRSEGLKPNKQYEGDAKVNYIRNNPIKS